MRLLPGTTDSAMSRPLIYCELTFPGRLYSPAGSCPPNDIGKVSALQPTPLRRSSRQSISNGREGSLPLPVTVTFFAPSAAAIGMINLAVEPDSPQSSTALSGILLIGVTLTVVPLRSI